MFGTTRPRAGGGGDVTPRSPRGPEPRGAVRTRSQEPGGRSGVPRGSLGAELRYMERIGGDMDW